MILRYTRPDLGHLTRTLALRYLEATIALDREAPTLGGPYGVGERARFVESRRECARAAKLLRPMLAAAGSVVAIDCYLGTVEFRLDAETNRSIHVAIIHLSQGAMFAETSP
jgi:hypothetical protein